MATDRDGLQPSSRGGFQPSDRGGLQPTPEERNAFGVLRDFFYQARDTLGRLKDKVEYLIVAALKVDVIGLKTLLQPGPILSGNGTQPVELSLDLDPGLF